MIRSATTHPPGGRFAWFQVFDNGEGAKPRPTGRASSASATRQPTRPSATARTAPLRALGRPGKRQRGRLGALTLGAVPGAAAGDFCVFSIGVPQRSQLLARTAVDLELALHRARRAVGKPDARVWSPGGRMPSSSARRIPRCRRRSSSSSRLPAWMQRRRGRVPERLVRIDVPDARDLFAGRGSRSLIGAPAAREPLPERAGRERNRAAPRRRARRGTARALPARAATTCRTGGHRGIRHSCRRRGSPPRGRERRPAGPRAGCRSSVGGSAAPPRTRSARSGTRRAGRGVATRSPTSSVATTSGSSGRVSRGSWISTCSNRRPFEHGCEPSANRLDLG